MVTVYIVPHDSEMIKTAKVVGEVASGISLGIALFTPIAQMGTQQTLAAILHVCAMKSQESVKKSISKVMSPLMVPGIASPNLSALVGNLIILTSVCIFTFAIHKAAPQIVKEYITWPYYLWQVISFLHQGTIFHSVHLVGNSDSEAGLKVFGVLVTLLYGVAGPYAMWRWHCRNKFEFRTHEAFRATCVGKYFVTHGSWGGNALDNHYGVILNDLSNVYALEWMIIFPAFNFIVCVIAAIQVDTSTGCKIQNTILGLLMIAFAVLHVIMLPRRSLYLNSCAMVSYLFLAVYTFAQAFTPFGAPPMIMIISGIVNTVAGVIAFFLSTYEAWKIRPVVWPEGEDKIPPKETEMEERLVPSRSDPEPTSSGHHYISFQDAVNTLPNFPLELCSTVLPSGAKPVQLWRKVRTVAVPQHNTIGHGEHAHQHHQHHQQPIIESGAAQQDPNSRYVTFVHASKTRRHEDFPFQLCSTTPVPRQQFEHSPSMGPPLVPQHIIEFREAQRRDPHFGKTRYEYFTPNPDVDGL